MKTAKYALAVLGLIILAGPRTVQADTTFIIAGTFTCNTGSCPSPISFAPGSTITINPLNLVTASSISIDGESYSGVPNVFNNAADYRWQATDQVFLELFNPLGSPQVGDLFLFSSPGVFAFDASGPYTLTPLTPVAEPGTISLLGAGLLGLISRRRRGRVRNSHPSTLDRLS